MSAQALGATRQRVDAMADERLLLVQSITTISFHRAEPEVAGWGGCHEPGLVSTGEKAEIMPVL